MLALGKTKDMSAAEFLVRKLDDPELNQSAEEALKEMGETAVEPLIEALKGGNEELKTEAALLLLEIGDEKAIESLIETY